jgi:RNA 2',3'-cyclic 3'-phosphodiesterase
MRTFIAIPLPEECRNMILQVQDQMRSFGADVRWTAIPSIHLTLKFLGEIDRGALPQLAAALRQQAVRPGFAVCIRGLGAFPELRHPKVLWYGIEGATDRLALLQAAIETACESLGFKREERAYHPHLTLGRVQGKKNLQPLMEYIKIGTGPERSFRADHFNIYQSVLSPRGANYTILEKIDLIQEA